MAKIFKNSIIEFACFSFHERQIDDILYVYSSRPTSSTAYTGESSEQRIRGCTTMLSKTDLLGNYNTFLLT